MNASSALGRRGDRSWGRGNNSRRVVSVAEFVAIGGRFAATDWMTLVILSISSTLFVEMD